MNSYLHVPPGFRFHPSDEELVDYYLRKKVSSSCRIDLDVIKDVDLYKIEPWDLQEICRIGREEENEWYFFSHKDRKYPTGTRTNRATAAGFWKATGRDKAIYSKHDDLIGMRKTLVFYKGRAPNGQKSDWIMHEYRLETDENATPQEEGWVVCRVFKKRVTTTTMRKVSEHDDKYDDQQVSLMHAGDFVDSSALPSQQSSLIHSNLIYDPYHIQPCKKEHMPNSREQFLQLPLLEIPKLLLQSSASSSNNNNNNQHMAPYGIILDHVNNHATFSGLLPPPLSPLFQHSDDLAAGHGDTNNNNNNIVTNEQLGVVDQVFMSTDWRVLDKFVASQLSQEINNESNNDDNNNSNSYSSSCKGVNIFQGVENSSVQYRNLEKQEIMHILPDHQNDNASSTSNSTSPIDLWK